MADTPIINFQEERDFSAKMNATYAFVKQNFKGLAKSLLFFSAPFVLLGSVFLSEMFARMLNISTTGGYGASPFDMEDYFDSTNFYLKLFAALLFMLVGGVFTVSTTYAYMLVYDEKKSTAIEIGEVWTKVRKLFWLNFASMFLYYIGAVLSALVLLIPVGLLVFAMAFISPILGGISYFLYYVFFFAFCIYFSMTFFICCRENINFFDALGRLFRLSKSNFWNTVIIGAVNFYIYYVFAFLFLIPFYLYLYISSLHNINLDPLSQSTFAEEVINTVLLMLYGLASVLFISFPLISLAFQYFDLVERKEARGLISRIASFGQTRVADTSYEDF